MNPEQPTSLPPPAAKPVQAAVSPEPADEDILQWQAPEYAHHDKSALWYIIVGIITVLCVGAAIYFQQYVFAVVLVVMAVALCYFAARKPQLINYRLSEHELQVGPKTFLLNSFRSFGILEEDTQLSIWLRPVKRLAPAVTIYFNEDDGDDIVDFLAELMPSEEIHPSGLDALMRRIGF